MVGIHQEHFGTVKNNEQVLYLKKKKKKRIDARNIEDSSRKQSYVVVSVILKYMHITEYTVCKNTI